MTIDESSRCVSTIYVWVDSLAIQRGHFAAVPVFTTADISIQITWIKIATEKCSALESFKCQSFELQNVNAYASYTGKM